jgi:hypothetical protein
VNLNWKTIYEIQIVLMLIHVLCSVFTTMLSYEMLSEFFRCLEGSTQLLLKGALFLCIIQLVQGANYVVR